MTTRPMPRQFLPGEPAPRSGAYQEHDPASWRAIRRLLIPAGDPFPAARTEGGFFTVLEPGHAAAENAASAADWVSAARTATAAARAAAP